MPGHSTILSMPSVRSVRATDVTHAALPASSLYHHYTSVRQATLLISDGLTPEDCALQSMPDASPVKWHLAHTSWFFETFVLEQAIPGYQHFHPKFRVLFNSYYVGDGGYTRHNLWLSEGWDVMQAQRWQAPL